MADSAPSAEDRLLSLFGRLRQLAFDQHPLQDSGVTMPQLTLLDWIATSPGCGIQEIADGLGLTAPTHHQRGSPSVGKIGAVGTPA